jgi:hypothetical protein
MSTHAANGRTELQMMRDDYLRDLRGYVGLVGTIWPGIVYGQLRAARDRYVEAGGNVDDLGNLPPPDDEGRAPHISGIPGA